MFVGPFDHQPVNKLVVICAGRPVEVAQVAITRPTTRHFASLTLCWYIGSTPRNHLQIKSNPTGSPPVWKSDAAPLRTSGAFSPSVWKGQGGPGCRHSCDIFVIASRPKKYTADSSARCHGKCSHTLLRPRGTVAGSVTSFCPAGQPRSRNSLLGQSCARPGTNHPCCPAMCYARTLRPFSSAARLDITDPWFCLLPFVVFRWWTASCLSSTTRLRSCPPQGSSNSHDRRKWRHIRTQLDTVQGAPPASACPVQIWPRICTLHSQTTTMMTTTRRPPTCQRVAPTATVSRPSKTTVIFQSPAVVCYFVAQCVKWTVLVKLPCSNFLF